MAGQCLRWLVAGYVDDCCIEVSARQSACKGGVTKQTSGRSGRRHAHFQELRVVAVEISERDLDVDPAKPVELHGDDDDEDE